MNWEVVAGEWLNLVNALMARCSQLAQERHALAQENAELRAELAKRDKPQP